MTLKLEVGKYYKNRLGEKVGPIENFDNKVFPFYSPGDLIYTEQGFYYNFDGTSDKDLIEELAEEDQSKGILSDETLGKIVRDTLMWHMKEGFDEPLTEEAFRVVIHYFGGQV